MMLAAVTGWVNREQRAIIDYLKEENRVLRELNGEKRLRFTNDQRRKKARGEGQDARSASIGGDRDARHSRHGLAVASRARCPEVLRWECKAGIWAAACDGGDSGVGGPDGHRE